MSDCVDAIMSIGRYVDRRGQRWERRPSDMWVTGTLNSFDVQTPGQMRLSIARDMHRSICPGLRYCSDHPVPRVFRSYGWWSALAPGTEWRKDSSHDTLQDAYEAARDLGVAAVTRPQPQSVVTHQHNQKNT